MSPRQPRPPLWICHCGTQNEASRATCRNASEHQPAPEPDGEAI